MRLLFLTFPEITKLNTREIFCNHHIAKLDTHKIYFFKIAKLSIAKFNTKLNHILKTDGDELFKDLPTNRIFSKEVLS